MKIIILFLILLSNLTFGQVRDKSELEEVTKQILKIVKKQSIVTDSINWIEFNELISKKVSQLNNIDSTNVVISIIFEKLRDYDDYHSFYLNKNYSSKLFSKDTIRKFSESKIIDDSIGYLMLPSHVSINKVNNTNYADSLRVQIEYLDRNYNIKGWIIDLRQNRGGNMWPMLAGLNPLIEDGVVGYFKSKKRTTKWKSNSKKPMNINKVKNSYKCKNLNTKIAILLDTITASSGEMTAISLLGRNNSKSFGKMTRGYTTANHAFELINGAYLFLASSYCEDKVHNKYIGKIKPDVEIKNNEEVLDIIKKWLLTE